MEVSVEVHKIIKCTIHITALFSTSGGGVDDVLVRLSLMEQIIKGCQFDEHLIQCHTFTDIVVIVNEFVQFDQNYFQIQCVYTPI